MHSTIYGIYNTQFITQASKVHVHAGSDPLPAS